MTKYIHVHYSIHDGEIEYGDRTVFEITDLADNIDIQAPKVNDLIMKALVKQLAYENFSIEDADELKENIDEEDSSRVWEDGQAWGRCLEVEEFKEIPKEHYDILKIYLYGETLKVDA